MAQTLFDLLDDPEAAAFAPAFAKDKRRKPSNIDVLNAGIAGIGDLAYDAAGFPVDLSVGLMRALGFDVGQTPMGSDWLKSKATDVGIRPPESADPTLRDVRLGAEMMAGGIDPFATAKGIGMAGSAIAREAAPIVGRGLENYANKAGLNMNMLPPEAAAKVMGQTKIVDEAGLPELYYRGAKSKYEPLSSAGVNAASKSGDIGLWMSKSPDLASSYTGSQGLGHVSPAYSDVRNPLVIDAGQSLWSEIPSKAVEDALGVKLSSPTVTTDQVARIAKDRGFDGVQFKNVIDVKGGRMATEASMQPTDVLVAFNPKAVRSALSDKAIAGVARVPPRPKAPAQQAVQKPTVQAPVSESGFYSAVEQAALNLEKTDGTGQGLLNELMKAPDVKKDEMDAIGLIDAFKDKPKATKQELIDYIGQNKIELGQSVLKNDYGPTRSKFQDYAFNDGENYQETLLTMPNQWEKPRALQEANSLRIKELRDQMHGTSGTNEIRAEISRLQNENQLLQKQINDAPIYTSSHWDQPNVMAHVRTQDFVDADGKNMRLIEEVQSDWHQAGREKGYKTSQSERKATSAIRKDGYWEVRDQNNEFVTNIQDWAMPDADEAKALEVANARIQANNATNMASSEMVPDAPMKETWYQTALRKAVKDAIDAGQDRVGITTGAQQVERYNLSKQASSIQYNPETKQLWVYGVGEESYSPIVSKIVSKEELSQYVGKEAADKLLKSKMKSQNVGGEKTLWHEIKGKDLQVGGEGMRKYYDDVYPKYLDKFAKKYGATVKDGNLTVGDKYNLASLDDGKTFRVYETETNKFLPKVFKTQADAEEFLKTVNKTQVRYIDITPEMRKAFGGKDKGVPLFQAAPLIPVGIGAGGLLDQFGERQQ